jgi:hypothetical protein
MSKATRCLPEYFADFLIPGFNQAAAFWSGTRSGSEGLNSGKRFESDGIHQLVRNWIADFDARDEKVQYISAKPQ